VEKSIASAVSGSPRSFGDPFAEARFFEADFGFFQLRRQAAYLEALLGLFHGVA